MSHKMCRIRLSPCLPALLVVATGTTAISGSHSDAGAGPSHPASLSLPQRFWAGGASRTVSQLVLYPVDAMRTLAQTRTGAKTLQDLGASVLVSGCLTTSAFALVVGAMQFAIIGACEPIFGNIGASVLGALGSCLASVPQEVIKQRLVTGIYPDFFSAVTTIYSAEGVAGFYTAWLPTVWRNVPFVVVTFTAFGELKRRRLNACGSLSVVDNLKIGVSAALFAGVLTQPIDVVKTRLMTQAASGQLPYKGIVDCVRSMVATEGPGSLYSGLLQRSLYMGPLWALQFALNGYITDRMARRNSRRYFERKEDQLE
mmetsp:Transcript_23652/g.39032  ORF Transcript_23652/g.39032 Transcript_23652/m.39032 type:complete len:314 (-) Transcript_23652:88-1029(-)